MKRPKPPATLDTVAQQLESLQRHIDSLDASMQRLFARLVPADSDWNQFRGQIDRKWEGPYANPETRNPPLSVERLIQMIREADAHIEGIERDFATVRARVDSVEHGELLRENMKPYLKKS
jgi:hypothetical protein